MKKVGPQEARDLMKQGWTYLDVRSEREFEEGHPEGAYNLPLLHVDAGGMVPNEDFARVVQKVFPKSHKLVVGCQSGGRSARAVSLLEQLGYQHLIDQKCGYGGARDAKGALEPGWAASGLPVERGAPDERAYVWLLRKGQSPE